MSVKSQFQFPVPRLLRVVDLPTLDGVLSHDAVDGKHIVRNIKPLARLVRLARHAGGSDSQGMCVCVDWNTPRVM